MDNNILTAFAVCGAVGIGLSVLPRAVAPSDTYIIDTLEPVTETTTEPFLFTVQPQDFTSADGEDVSFSVAVNQFSTVVSYLWQYATPSNPDTFIDIPNSDFSVFNLVSSAAEDGYLYRCIATYGGQSIISDVVLLTVLAAENEPTTTTTLIEGVTISNE